MKNKNAKRKKKDKSGFIYKLFYMSQVKAFNRDYAFENGSAFGKVPYSPN